MINNWQRLVIAVANPTTSPSDRCIAARELGYYSNRDVLAALEGLATNHDLPHIVGEAVGSSIARIGLELGCVDQFPLYDFSESAYRGYDREIARAERQPGPP